MTIDHLSFGTQDLIATRWFYEDQLGFPVLIHECLKMEEGGWVDHIFFDCGGGCALAFMQWHDVPGVQDVFDPCINRGLGVPNGTYHFALRCPNEVALAERRLELMEKGVVVGELISLDPYESFFLEDPVNGLRMEYTTRLRLPNATDRDPSKRQFQANLALFELVAQPNEGDQAE
jgi:catechol 2,3-dioxygenase-like lactoylglutathione lyase family enzyme